MITFEKRNTLFVWDDDRLQTLNGFHKRVQVSFEFLQWRERRPKELVDDFKWQGRLSKGISVQVQWV